MKKAILWILATLFMLTLLFVACDENLISRLPIGTDTQTSENAPDMPDPSISETEPETEPHVHAFGEWVTVKEASCTAAGEQQRPCACGEAETESIEALGHTEAVDQAIAPTCTQSGMTEGKHCSVCSEVLTAQEIVEALGHTEVIDHAVLPTCTETGLSEGKHCSVCDEILTAQDVISALGHTEVIDERIEPNCTEAGVTEGKHCSVCGTHLVVRDLIPAKGHVPVVDEAVAPTCTASGLREGKHCGVCQEILVAQDWVVPTGHKYGQWYETVAPTESQKGEKRRDCVNCDKVEVIALAELTHSHDRWETVILEAVAPTCVKTGLTEGAKCSGCGEILIAQESVPALGHSYESVVTEPTCTQRGYTTYTCHCGRTYKDDYISNLGHVDLDTDHHCDRGDKEDMGRHADNNRDHACDYGCAEPIGEHLTSEGSHYCSYCRQRMTECVDENKDHECDICGKGNMGEHYDSPDDNDHVCDYGCDGWPLEDHSDEVESVVEPTCTEEGYTNYVCTVCGEKWVGAYQQALGHNEVWDKAVAPTCTEVGWTRGKHCSRCNEVFIAQEEIPAAHTWSEEYEWDDQGHWHLCTVCDQISEKIAHQAGTDGYCTACALPLCPTDGVTYAVSEDGTYAQVTGYEGGESRIVIAEQYEGLPVKAIGASAFKGSGLTRVQLPDSITEIGENAFYECKSLTAINLPEGVTRISYYAFANCYCLKEIVIPEGVTELSAGVFYSCTSLVQVTLPKVGTRIGYQAFFMCESLKSIIVPEGVTEIGDSAFLCCHGLTDVSIPDSVTEIGTRAFQSCESLANLSIPDNVTSIGQWAFEGCSSLIQVENGVSYVDGMVFDADTSIETVVLREDTRRILTYAFSACAALTSVTIPDSVAYIDENAFDGCAKLKEITLPSSMTSIGASAFYGCTGLEKITIPDNITSIDRYAFGKCTNLINVIIPDSVTSIEDHAFYYCKSMMEITIPKSVTRIGEKMLHGCDNLASITLPFVGEAVSGTSNTDLGYLFLGIPQTLKTVIITGGTRIEPYAFDNCEYVKNIVIPDSVTYIGKGAFRGCRNLESITLPFVGEAKDGTENTYFEYVFGSDVNSYGRTPVTLKVINITGGESIGQYAFRGCSKVTSIILPDSLTSIGEHAFSGCASLTEITIPNCVTEIGSNAFSGCISLTEIDIPDGIKIVDFFNGCTSLKNVFIPNSVTEIGAYAFYGCSGLLEITVPDSVTRIGNNAFEGCTGLTSITIPFVGGIPDGPSYPDGTSYTNFGYLFGTMYYKYNDKYVPESLRTVVITGGTSINSHSFQNCVNITEIIISDGVETIEYSAFEGCTSLKSVILPDSIINLSAEAFYGCTALESIIVTTGNKIYHSIGNCVIETAANKVILGCKTSEIPDGVETIGRYAFYGCAGLTSITIPDSVVSIEAGAFDGCTGLTSITIPDSVTNIDDYTFWACTGLTSIIIPDNATNIGMNAFFGCSNLTSITISDSMTHIAWSAFAGCTSLTDVYYAGTEEEWQAIEIGGNNDPLKYATIHYNWVEEDA